MRLAEKYVKQHLLNRDENEHGDGKSYEEGAKESNETGYYSGVGRQYFRGGLRTYPRVAQAESSGPSVIA
jgi:hypothetical protein